jgi:DNA invertase Pin-like site-specific DNA recombinase
MPEKPFASPELRKTLADINLHQYDNAAAKFKDQLLACVQELNTETHNLTVLPPMDQRPLKVRHRVALYARVSTRDKGQDNENQLAQLREYCKHRDWPIIGEYIDNATGKTADRPRFKQLFTDAARGQFDLVMFWSLDRFSREGVLDTLQHLQKLTAAAVDWRSFTEQYLDSCGVFRDAVLAILATIARQERIRNTERTIAGMARAKEAGKQIGRPKRIVNRQKIVDLRKAGLSFGEIGKQMKLPRGTVYQYFKELSSDQ